MRYRPEIDGLRAVAVIPVILFHAGIELFSGGYVGVDIFFVISGYLITTIIIAEMDTGSFSLANFYERRARRILPALFFVMIVCIPVAWIWLLPVDMTYFAKSVVAVATFSSNILFWRESGYFDLASELKPLLHTWSLAVEEQYYVLFPLFLMVTWRLGVRWIIAILGVAFIVSLGLAHWGSFYKPSATFFLLPTRGFELLIGVFVAFYLFRQPHIKGNQALSLLGILMIIYSIFAFDNRTPFPSLYTLVPTLGVALIILFTTPKMLAYRFLGNRVFVGIGLISYSAYLWHQPMLAFARHISLTELSWAMTVGLILATIVLAYISWRFVEKPFRDKNAISGAQILKLSLLFATAFTAFGLFGFYNNGQMPFAPIQEADIRYVATRQVVAERREEIRGGQCHFNEKGRYYQIAPFIENWSCYSDDEKHLTPLSVGIYGDSLSADQVVAFRLNGFDVVQIGAIDCPLLPSDIAAPYCMKTLAKFQEVAAERTLDTIALVNRYSDHELSREYLSDLINYWSARYPHIIIFSPMPEFKHFHKEYIRTGKLTQAVSFSKSQKFFAVLREIDVPPNVDIANSATIFCGADLACEFIVDGNLLLMDNHHLSPDGARKFGSSFFETEIGKRLIEK